MVKLNTYVKFNSKADVSEYLWGNRKGAAALDRYLARFDNKAPVLYKKNFNFLPFKRYAPRHNTLKYTRIL